MQSKEKKRIERLKKKIQNLYNTYKKRCLFLTLTFNDATLTGTNEKTRERYIKKYLNENTAIYICNRDYGTKTNREHYHAFIVTTTLKAEDIPPNLKRQVYIVNFEPFKKYGYIDAKYINSQWRHKEDFDNEKMAQDVANHFIKESAKKSAIIQSRKVPNKYTQLSVLENRLKKPI